MLHHKVDTLSLNAMVTLSFPPSSSWQRKALSLSIARTNSSVSPDAYTWSNVMILNTADNASTTQIEAFIELIQNYKAETCILFSQGSS